MTPHVICYVHDGAGRSVAAFSSALALISEAIAFSTIPGVDPKVRLYASFCIAVVSAFCSEQVGMPNSTRRILSLEVGP